MTTARRRAEHESQPEGRNASIESPVIEPGEGDPFAFGPVGGRFKMVAGDTGGRFAVAHLLDLPTGVLGAPPHRHHNEDEYSYVLEGTLHTLLGDEVRSTRAGSWIFKPRGQWHTFWNGSDEPCSVIEVVSPAGFESYFEEVAEAGGERHRLARINQRYGIEMDFERIPGLCDEHGLSFPQR